MIAKLWNIQLSIVGNTDIEYNKKCRTVFHGPFPIFFSQRHLDLNFDGCTVRCWAMSSLTAFDWVERKRCPCCWSNKKFDSPSIRFWFHNISDKLFSKLDYLSILFCNSQELAKTHRNLQEVTGTFRNSQELQEIHNFWHQNFQQLNRKLHVCYAVKSSKIFKEHLK